MTYRFLNKKKKKPILVKISIVIFICLLGLAIFLSINSGFFNIRIIEVSLDRRLDCVNQDQIKDVSKLFGSNLIFINYLKLKKDIKGKFICVKEVTLSKIFPSKIKISVFGRDPVAILISMKSLDATTSASLENIATPSAESTQDAYLIDNEGILFSKEINNISMSKIFLGNTNLSLGQKLESNITEASLKILSKVKMLGLNEEVMMIFNNFLIVFSDPKIIFRLDEKVDMQIASLQLILKVAKIDSSQLEFIDLRFDKPIIRIAPKKNG